MWALLLVTLPTRPNAVRLRVWRALKALGCAALRDGAFVLPVAQASRFDPLAAQVRTHSGQASVFELSARDPAHKRKCWRCSTAPRPMASGAPTLPRWVTRWRP
jgi:hypothetical protein